MDMEIVLLPSLSLEDTLLYRAGDALIDISGKAYEGKYEVGQMEESVELSLLYSREIDSSDLLIHKAGASLLFGDASELVLKTGEGALPLLVVFPVCKEAKNYGGGYPCIAGRS